MARLGCGMEGLGLRAISVDCKLFHLLWWRGIKEFLSSKELYDGHLDVSKFRQQQSREFKYCFLCI